MSTVVVQDTQVSVIEVGIQGPAGPNIMTSNVPAIPTSTGVKGRIAYDTNYIYICVDTNTWKRIAFDGSWV